MKIRLKFKNWQIVLIAAVMAIALASVILNSLIIAEVAGFINYNEVMSGLALAGSALILAFGFLVFTASFFSFKDGKLTLYLAGFADTVKYENMTALRLNSTTDTLFVIYTIDKRGFKKDAAIAFAVDHERNDEIVTFLRKKNPDLLYEIFDEKADEDVK